MASLSYHVFGKEKGESGTPHLQGYTVFKKTQRFPGVRKLFKTDRVALFERKGTHQQASLYCKKDGKYFEFGTVEEIGKKKSPFAAIADCTSYEEASTLIETEASRDWYLHGETIRDNLKRKFIPRYPPYVPIFDCAAFKIPQDLTDWIKSWSISRTKTLFLYGDSCLGKTAWARSIIQPHTYWKGLLNLDEFNPDSKLLIFDDFDWKFFNHPKNWLTQAGQCTVTDKYRHKKTIMVTMPAIWICNDLPEWTPNESKYWTANAEFVQIKSKLF